MLTSSLGFAPVDFITGGTFVHTEFLEGSYLFLQGNYVQLLSDYKLKGG